MLKLIKGVGLKMNKDISDFLVEAKKKLLRMKMSKKFNLQEKVPLTMNTVMVK